MGHDSLDPTMLYVRGTKQDLQQNVEKIAWIYSRMKGIGTYSAP